MIMQSDCSLWRKDRENSETKSSNDATKNNFVIVCTDIDKVFREIICSLKVMDVDVVCLS